MKVDFKVEGMTCASCQSHVEKAVKKVDGVENVNVSLLTNSMSVECIDTLDLNKINKAVSNAGYKSYIKGNNNKKEEDLLKDNATTNSLKRLIISIILLIPLAVISMSYMCEWIPSLMNFPYTIALIGLVLSSLIIIVNRHFFISGVKALIHLSPNMDTLVSLGASISYIYSLILFFIMTLHVDEPMYSMSLSMNLSFETCGMILTFITIGKTLESYSKGKTTNAIKSLIDLSPKKACKIENDKEIIVDIVDVKVGDIVRIKPGENVSIDGVIIKGETSIDESLLTGESIPLDKKIGDKVYTATSNKLGSIDVEVLKETKDSTLSNIIKLVSDASSSKAPISRIADKISYIFVPFVLIVSLITFLVWFILGLNGLVTYTQYETNLSYSLNKAISVLVISCPCGLGLATPVAIMVGSGKGARNNILFKSAEALEECGKASFAVLDKTGTITKGKPEIKNIISYIDKSEFLSVAKSIESLSNHPLAVSITNGIDTQVLNVDKFKTLVSVGVEGYINNSYILACNIDYAKNNNYISNNEFNEASKYAKSGETVVLFLKDYKLIGFITLQDKIKEDSKEAISKIKSLGINVVMLTGDNRETARAIAKEANVDYFVSSVSVEEKSIVVNRLKEYGKVIMVGDGINDSVALTSANVGIAIGSGADVAIDSADCVLMRSSLMDLYKAIRLSQKTYINILENLFWAFIYNLIMIPIASGAFKSLGMDLKPYYGALSMSLSSVCVVLNALRLNIVSIDKNRIKKNKINLDFNEVLKLDKDKEITLKVEGMMCNHCIKTVEDIVKKYNNVINAKASLENNNVVIYYKDKIDINNIIDDINNADYKACKEE